MPFVEPEKTNAIGIVGSRRRDTEQDYCLCLRKFLNIYEPGQRIVSGGCPLGGDRFAEIIALRLVMSLSSRRLWDTASITRKIWIGRYGAPITIHPAHWDVYGKAAGVQRNSLIVADCDILVALPSNDRTGGTEDTIEKAHKLGKKVILV